MTTDTGKIVLTDADYETVTDADFEGALEAIREAAAHAGGNMSEAWSAFEVRLEDLVESSADAGTKMRELVEVLNVMREIRVVEIGAQSGREWDRPVFSFEMYADETMRLHGANEGFGRKHQSQVDAARIPAIIAKETRQQRRAKEREARK